MSQPVSQYGTAGYSQPWLATPRATEPIDWTGELITAIVGTVFIALAGGLVGLIWHAVAPKLSIAAVAAESDAAFRAQIGADAWFILVGALAGLGCALALRAVVSRPGPGAAIALGVGGFLGAFVADRVGYLAERGATIDALHRVGANIDGTVISEVDFRLRALGVVSVWPLVSLLVLAGLIGLDALRRH